MVSEVEVFSCSKDNGGNRVLDGVFLCFYDYISAYKSQMAFMRLNFETTN